MDAWPRSPAVTRSDAALHRRTPELAELKLTSSGCGDGLRERAEQHRGTIWVRKRRMAACHRLTRGDEWGGAMADWRLVGVDGAEPVCPAGCGAGREQAEAVLSSRTSLRPLTAAPFPLRWCALVNVHRATGDR